jgi:predicted permease
MVDILNLALPYFGLIFIGFACGKTKGLSESGLAWMNFFLLYVSLPALLFRIMSDTPFSELNNPPFLIATTLATISAFVLAMVAGRIRSARRDRDQAAGPSAHRVRVDAAVRPVRAALGSDRGPDGRTATGAERVRDRPAE